jgi:hypothetical protein
MFLSWGLDMFPKLASNLWAQVVPHTQPPQPSW